MKSKSTRLFVSILIGVSFAVTVGALFGRDAHAPTPWLSVHEIAGTLYLAGSFAHLFMHRDWMWAVLSRPGGSLPASVRRNLSIDLGMAVFGLLVGVSGAVIALNPGLAGWEHLHRLSGVTFALLTIAHMLLHGKWMRAAIKDLVAAPSGAGLDR